jgi:hypothetical protein
MLLSRSYKVLFYYLASFEGIIVHSDDQLLRRNYSYDADALREFDQF